MENYRVTTVYIDEDDHITAIKILPDKIYICLEIGTIQEVSRINCKEVLVKIETKRYTRY